jgi:predicted nuclease of predicted toxin-antitoxin system
MKVLFDENIPHSLVIHAINQGYDVLDIKKSKYKAYDDPSLCHFAIKHNYIIVTYDKDYLDLYKRNKLLRCIFLHLRTLDRAYIVNYFNGITKDYENILKTESFLLYCTKEKIQLL